MKRVDGLRRLPAALLLGALLAPAPATAAVLLGTGTLNNPDDLTRVQTSAGSVLEFLDLPATKAMTVAEALSIHSPLGFRWANGAEVGELFDVFGIAYASSSNASVDLGAAVSDVERFVDYLGYTTIYTVSGYWPVLRGSLGWIDDLTTTTLHTYACVGSYCSPFAFTWNTQYFWPQSDSHGVFLVRDGVVPEPSGGALVGLGLAGLAAARRRKAHA